MRITETSTSPSSQCLRLYRAASVARYPQARPPPRVEKPTTLKGLAALFSRSRLPPDCLRIFPAGNRECLNHGYVLHSRYQVVYPFPTFQPAFQLKKDQVILLNTSYSLVACGISLCPGSTRRASPPPNHFIFWQFIVRTVGGIGSFCGDETSLEFHVWQVTETKVI